MVYRKIVHENAPYINGIVNQIVKYLHVCKENNFPQKKL